MYIDIFNLSVLLAAFFAGALVFFLGFYCANNINNNDNDDNIVKPYKSSKSIKSNVRDKTDVEKEAEEKEHTVFYN
jgi:hypothetical protein